MEVQTDAYPNFAEVENMLAGYHSAIYNKLMLNAQLTR